MATGSTSGRMERLTRAPGSTTRLMDLGSISGPTVANSPASGSTARLEDLEFTIGQMGGATKASSRRTRGRAMAP